MTDKHSINIVETDGDLEGCLDVRRAVFIVEQQIAEADEIDEYDTLDAECTHFIARKAQSPVGTARLRIVNGAAKLQRGAVLKSHRGQGIATALLRAMLDHVRAQKLASQAILSSQLGAMDVYAKIGFVAVGDIYDDVGIPHRDMTLDLTQS